jgi:hypothetical protein
MLASACGSLEWSEYVLHPDSPLPLYNSKALPPICSHLNSRLFHANTLLTETDGRSRWRATRFRQWGEARQPGFVLRELRSFS